MITFPYLQLMTTISTNRIKRIPPPTVAPILEKGEGGGAAVVLNISDFPASKKDIALVFPNSYPNDILVR